MKDGRIKNEQISASSEFTNENTKRVFIATFARLDRYDDWKAWTADIEDVHQWIQVEFGVPNTVAGIILQRRSSNLNVQRWVTKYKVTYSNDEGASWLFVKDQEGQNHAVRN